MTMNVNELFQEAFNSNIKFNHYHAFISEEVEKYFLLKTRNVDEKFLGRESEL